MDIVFFLIFVLYIYKVFLNYMYNDLRNKIFIIVIKLIWCLKYVKCFYLFCFEIIKYIDIFIKWERFGLDSVDKIFGEGE